MIKRLNNVTLVVGHSFYVRGRLHQVLYLTPESHGRFVGLFGETWDFPCFDGTTKVPDLFLAHKNWLSDAWDIGQGHTLPSPRRGEVWVCGLLRFRFWWVCLPIEFVSQGGEYA